MNPTANLKPEIWIERREKARTRNSSERLLSLSRPLLHRRNCLGWLPENEGISEGESRTSGSTEEEFT
ncbi:hypothetical protein AAHA92_01666 [Salvia divinorum]|uniref:Uncharacterized protein n=1 Tax=Salvia divinorum TaxID=28513 RepID=A0ABD1IBB4_SALDI